MLSSLIQLQLDVDYIYIADHAHAPYGGKEDDQILLRSQTLCHKLLSHSVDAIVVACNTATAVAIDQLRSEFSLPIIGIEPFLTAAQKFSIAPEDQKHQVVLVTPSMFKSKRFKILCQHRDPQGLVKAHACPTMAGLIEQAFDHPDPQPLIKTALNDLEPLLDQGFKYAVLGCTHYPLIRQSIEQYLGLTTLSPCHYVARRVAQVLSLPEHAQLDSPVIHYASSKDFIFRNLKPEDLQLVARD